MWTVYKHQNKLNGKCYVGITSKTPEQRWGKNGRNYASVSKTHGCFYDAILKYGWDNFTHEILCEGLSQEEACQMERKYIAEYNCKVPNGYNLTDGGEGMLGYKVSEKFRERRRELTKGGKNPTAKRVLYGDHVFDTISDCANFLGVTDDHIRRWLNGKSIIPEEHLRNGLRIEGKTPIYKTNAEYKDRENRTTKVLYLGVVYSSINDCAKKIGVSSKVLRDWLRGKHGIKDEYSYLLDSDLCILGEEQKLKRANYENLYKNFSKDKEAQA